MYTAILIAHLVICATLIGIVLLQHGKGADAGAAFGSGASATVFGARGATSFLGKVTGILAAGFFATSLVLAMLAGTYGQSESVINSGAGQRAAPVQKGTQKGPPPLPPEQQATSDTTPPSMAPAGAPAPAPAPESQP